MVNMLEGSVDAGAARGVGGWLWREYPAGKEVLLI